MRHQCWREVFFSNHTCLRILRIWAHRSTFLRIRAHRSTFLRIRAHHSTFLRIRAHRSTFLRIRHRTFCTPRNRNHHRTFCTLHNHNHCTCRESFKKIVKIVSKIKICKIRTFSCNHHHSVGRICGCWNRCRSSCAAYPCRHSDHKV